MLTYRIRVYFYDGTQHSWNPGPGDVPEGCDEQSLPEGVWCDKRPFSSASRRTEPYRDPHGFLERFAATEVGALLASKLRAPYAVECEVEEAMP